MVAALPDIRLPGGPRVRSPAAKITIRFGIAVAIVLVNWLLVVIEHNGYRDSYDGTVSVFDALYYTTVTLSTTGYGDITPVTTSARVINALVVTPLRLVFVVLLVLKGTDPARIVILDSRSSAVTAAEVGRGALDLDVPVLAVLRDGRTLPYDDPAAATSRDGDRIVHAITVSGN